MHAALLVTLAISVAISAGLNTSLRAAAERHTVRTISVERSLTADSIEITNTHPHSMTAAVLADTGEVVLGAVPAGQKVKFPVVIPPGTKELRLTAYDPLDRRMSVDGKVQVTPGKPLTWEIGVD